MTFNLKPTTFSFELECEFKEFPLAFVNSLRRVILTEIPTIAFNNIDYLNADIKILENTSSLHNEFILERISLVPIHIKNTDDFDPNNYTFKLDIENKTKNVINVTIKDIEVYDKTKNTLLTALDFFKPNPITEEFITILKLHPNPNGKGELIKMEGSPSKGIGKTHANYSPVSCVTFKNKRDPIKVEQALQEYLDKHIKQKNNKEELKQLSLDFELSLADRYFMTDDDDEPNQFEFYIESKGVYTSKEILSLGLKVLKQKINMFKDNVSKIVKNKETLENVSIKESLDTMKSFDITVLKESHTLGNIIQTYALKSNLEDLNFIGYKNPHPLKDFIIIKISTKEHSMNELLSIIDITCDTIIKDIDIVSSSLSS